MLTRPKKLVRKLPKQTIVTTTSCSTSGFRKSASPLEHERERAAEHGVTAKSGFLIQWNKEGGAEYIPEIPRVMYESFGRDKVLVFDLNYELIPPS